MGRWPHAASQDGLTGRRRCRIPLCMFRLHLTCERKVFVTFVFFVWSSVRRRQDMVVDLGAIL